MKAIVEHLEGLLSNNWQWTKDLFSLMRMEAQLAGLSVLPLCFYAALILLILLSIWLVSLGLIAGLVYELTGSLLGALFFLFFLNSLLLAVLIYRFRRNLKRMSFMETRASLNRWMQREKNVENQKN